MSTAEALAAINKSITVDASQEAAFQTFTQQIATWWPRSHTVFEDRVQDIVFDARAGGRVYERSADGEEADWADVLTWEPNSRFVLRWRVNPKRGATELDVRFTPDGDGTRVDLEHRGWDDPEGRANYGPGWDQVLGHYIESFRSE